MNGDRKGAGPVSAPVEEDPNAAIACSSPPCFMHELDPSYLGYLGREEVSALLEAVLAAGWGGAVPDEARLRDALRQRCGTRNHGPDRATEALPRPPPDRLAPMIREALPRIHDDVLRRDLGEVLGALERGIRRER